MKLALRLCLTVLFLSLNPKLKAQEYRYEFGADLGTGYYSGDLARKGLIAPQSLTAGLLARYNLNFRWAMTANLSYQTLRSSLPYAKNVFPDQKETLSFSSRLVNLGYGMEFNFFPFSDKYRYLNTSSFSPYIYAGAGLNFAWGTKKSVFSPNLSLGIGAKYKFDKHWTASLMWQWAYSLTDKLDALSEETEILANPYNISYGDMKGKDGFARITLGLSYAFGLRKDTNCAVPNVNL